MKYNTFPLLILCTFSFKASRLTAQGFYLPSPHIAKSLVNSGIDTVVIYNPCNLPLLNRQTDSSRITEISYLITKKGSQLNIERLTYEYPYDRGQILTHNFINKKDSLGIFDYLHNNFSSIFSDTLLPTMLKDRIAAKDTLFSYQPSHSCYYELIVVTAAGKFTNGISDRNLYDGIQRNVDGSIRGRVESINYKHNTSTSIFKIISMIQIVENEIKKIYQHS